MPPLPATLNEVQNHITTLITTVDSNMLRRVWGELQYRKDICCVTRKPHRASLNVSKQIFIDFSTHVPYNCTILQYLKCMFETRDFFFHNPIHSILK